MQKTTNNLTSFYRFIGLAYALSWSFWIPAALLQQDLMTFPTLLLHTLGGFGPSAAGILMTYRTQDQAGRRNFWRRVVDFQIVGVGWTLFCLVIFPLLALVSILLSRLWGAPLHLFTTLQHLAGQPLLLAGLLLAGLLAGPLPEELGWRGFALDSCAPAGARCRPAWF